MFHIVQDSILSVLLGFLARRNLRFCHTLAIIRRRVAYGEEMSGREKERDFVLDTTPLIGYLFPLSRLSYPAEFLFETSQNPYTFSLNPRLLELLPFTKTVLTIYQSWLLIVFYFAIG